MVLPPAKLMLLRRAYADICKGYSVTAYRGRPLYIRHLGHYNHLDYDVLQEQFEKQAVKIGAKTEVEKMAALRVEGLWNEQKDKDIEVKKDYLIRLEDGKKQTALPSMIKNYEHQIEEEKKALQLMLNDKAELLGMTAELYAQRKLNDHYVVTNLFLNNDLTNRVFETDVFDSLSDEEIEEVLSTYYSAIEPCVDSNLRILSVQDFFTAAYSLAQDDIYNFFGKPICELTYYQIRLSNIARYFKAISEQTDLSRVDPNIRNDPDAIERLHISHRNAEKMASEGKVPTGMTSSDVKDLGLQGKMTKVVDGLSGADLVKHLRSQQR